MHTQWYIVEIKYPTLRPQKGRERIERHMLGGYALLIVRTHPLDYQRLTQQVAAVLQQQKRSPLKSYICAPPHLKEDVKAHLVHILAGYSYSDCHPLPPNTATEIRQEVLKNIQNLVQPDHSDNSDDLEVCIMSNTWYVPIDAVVTVNVDDPVGLALGMLNAKHLDPRSGRLISFRHLVVKDGEKVVGILDKQSVPDIVEAAREPVRIHMIPVDQIPHFSESKEQIRKKMNQDPRLKERINKYQALFIVDKEKNIIGFATLVDLV